MTQPGRRKRDDRDPFEKTAKGGETEWQPDGPGTEGGFEGVEGGWRRSSGCGGVIGTESKWTGPRGHR